MANRNTVGFGLIPSGALGGTAAAGGQNKYKIDSGYGSSIYLGQPVQYDTAGGANDNPGYIINGQDAITRPTIGVFNGCFYTDATTNKPTFSSYFPRTTAPANSEDVDAFIIDNPLQQYNVQLDTRLGANADAAQAQMGSTFGLTVSANGAASANSGSTLSGQSNSQLTVGTASNAVANQWRLLRSAEDPENEDLITTPQTNPALANFSGQATVVVVANQSQWFGSGQVSA
jgi:hypothetical protein